MFIAIRNLLLLIVQLIQCRKNVFGLHAPYKVGDDTGKFAGGKFIA